MNRIRKSEKFERGLNSKIKIENLKKDIDSF